MRLSFKIEPRQQPTPSFSPLAALALCASCCTPSTARKPELLSTNCPYTRSRASSLACDLGVRQPPV